jgi:hypothetical protein
MEPLLHLQGLNSTHHLPHFNFHSVHDLHLYPFNFFPSCCFEFFTLLLYEQIMHNFFPFKSDPLIFLGRSPLQQEASPTVSQGGSSSSSPLSARGKLVNMVRVFKEDIQKRKDESDRKSGKGGSGAPKFIFCLFVFFATLNLSNVFFGHYVIRIGNPFSSYSIDLNV